MKKNKEWIDRGEHDMEAAQLLLDRKAHADVVLFHIHQAVEKYLKAFLIHHGWRLKKIHDLETLITEAADFDDVFEDCGDWQKADCVLLHGTLPAGTCALLSGPGNKTDVGNGEQTRQKDHGAITKYRMLMVRRGHGVPLVIQKDAPAGNQPNHYPLGFHYRTVLNHEWHECTNDIAFDFYIPADRKLSPALRKLYRASSNVSP